jgi:protein arginine kinase activator
MSCQNCSAEATVHLTESRNGRLREIHLCARCAQAAGIAAGDAKPKPLGLDAVLDKLIATHVGELVGEMARRKCPACGLTFMEFRVGGRLGCPADFETFAPALVPLLRKAHGASRHVGKMPSRRRIVASPRLGLRADLRRAVAREDYETAARLRDQLRQGDSD